MRRAGLAVAGAVALVGGLLVGCSSEDEPQTATPSGSASTSPTSPSGSGVSTSPAASEDPDDPAYDAALSTPREDTKYPAHGDPGIDTLHYGLDLSYDPSTRVLTGTADITLRATTAAQHFQLDLRRDFDVSSVSVDGTPVRFQQTKADLLVVTAPVAADQRYVVVVEYAGIPRRAWAPTTRQDTPFLGFQVADDGSVYTMQEPYGAFTWYPVNDQPSDKAFYDFTLRTPADWVGIANGQLTSRETEGDQTVTHWHLDQPAASYLTTMAMGDYVETTDQGADGTPISYWTKKGDSASLAKLKAAPAILAWNEKHLGPYPFSSLGYVVVDSQSAMETQTMITLGDTDYSLSKPVIEHETTHQWYGDLVTPTDWRDVWMNEGMTMFIQLAYEASLDGTSIDREINENRTYEAYERFAAGPPGDYKTGQFGEGNIYYGPALMWNALRHRMGNQAFWAMVKKWPTVHADGNATRAQYFTWLEQETGLRLKPFLQAWIMGQKSPKGLTIP